MSDDLKNYDVGYGKPPRARQFIQGQSGNPKGRPKGAKSMDSILANLSSKRIPVREGNRTRLMSIKEAILTNMVMDAAKGNRHSRKEFFQLVTAVEAREEAGVVSIMPHERDKAVFEGIKRRLILALSSSPDAVEETSVGMPTGGENE